MHSQTNSPVQPSDFRSVGSFGTDFMDGGWRLNGRFAPHRQENHRPISSVWLINISEIISPVSLYLSHPIV